MDCGLNCLDFLAMACGGSILGGMLRVSGIAGTEYVGPWGQPKLAPLAPIPYAIAPKPLVVSNLNIQLEAPCGAGQSVTFALYVNGAATGLSLTLAGAVQVTAADTTTQIPLAVGDSFSWQRIESAAATYIGLHFGALLQQ